MSVIIRLQNLPWSANALDIRAFFRGLSIPDGGVHIVGGEMGDAFIAFSTDEDARQAMMLDRGKVNEVQIRLLLSSRAEMQKVIEAARKHSLAMMQMQQQQQQQQQQQKQSSQMPQSSTSQQELTPLNKQSNVETQLIAAQPPVITSTSLKNILAQSNTNQRIPGLGDSTGNSNRLNQSYTTFLINDNSLESSKSSRDRLSLEKDDTNKASSRRSKERDRFKDSSRSRSKSRSRSRSRSRDRDRRRSRSRDRGSRRRRDSRSHSRDRDRDRKRDRYSRRSRSRSRDRYRNRYDRSRANDRNDNRRNSWEKDHKRNDQKEFEKDKKDLSEVPMVIDDENAKSSSPPSVDVQNKNFSIWNVPPPSQINSTSPFVQLPFNQQQQQQQSQTQNQIPFYQVNPFAAAAAMQAQFPQQFPAMQSKESDKPAVSGNQSSAELANSTNMLNFQNLFHAQNNFSFPTSSASNFNQLGINGQQLPFKNPYVTSTATDTINKEPNGTSTASSNQKKMPNFSGIFNNSSYGKDIKVENNDLQPNTYNIKNKSNEDSNKYYPTSSLSTAHHQQQQRSLATKDNSSKSNDKNYPRREEVKRDRDINPVTEINYEELKGRCVKISNMCSSTTYSDLRRFFSGLYIANNGIKMINDKHGLRVGTAYVRFIREESKPKALARSGQLLKTKNVVIESATEDEFDEEIDSFKPQRQNRSNQKSFDKNRTGCGDSEEDDNDDRHSRTEEKSFSSIILEDLPAFAKEQDVMKMFSAYTLLDIILGNRLTKTGRNENVCYVKFAKEEDARDAVREKHKHMIGYKQISVKGLDDEEFNEAKEKHNDEIEGVHRKKYREEEQEESIKEDKHQRNQNSEENKPSETSKENMNKTEEDDERCEDKNILNNVTTSRGEKDDNIGGQLKGHPTNFDSFNNREDALNEDNKSQDATRLSLDIRDPRLDNSRSSSHSNDIPSLLSLPQITTETRPPIRSGNNKKPSRFNQPNKINEISNANQEKTIYILMRNCDYKATKQDIANLFLPINISPNRVEILYNNRNQPSGEVIVEFLTAEDAEKSLIKSNTQCLSRNVRIELISPRIVANRLGENFLTQFNCPLTFSGGVANMQNNLLGGSLTNTNIGNNMLYNNLNYNNTVSNASTINDNSNSNFNNNDFETNLLRLLLTSGNLNIGDVNANSNNAGFNNPALQDVINRFRVGSTNSDSGNMNTMMRNNNNSNSNNINNNNNNNNNSNNNNNNNSNSSNMVGDNRNARRGSRPSRFSDKNEGSQNFSNNGINSNNNNNNNTYNNQNTSTLVGKTGVNNNNNNNTSGLGNTNMLNGPINHANVDQFGQPGCVVEMENVPYKAGIEDILNFFNKFNIAPCNVIRRYNDDGTPTGDARVAFSSPVEARSAIEAKRHHKIFNRTIYLSLL